MVWRNLPSYGSRTTSDSVYFLALCHALFVEKDKTTSTTKSDGAGACCVRLWFIRGIVQTGWIRRKWARMIRSDFLYSFLVFSLLCRHTASPSITSETHTIGVQYEGSPQNPDRIKRYSRNGSWTWRHTHTHIDKQHRSRTKHTSINTQHGYTTHTRNSN